MCGMYVDESVVDPEESTFRGEARAFLAVT